MIYARHLPTQRFTAAEFNAMPVGREDDFGPEGFSRWPDRRGKAIVAFLPPFDPSDRIQTGHYAVRPIVRVRAVTERVE